ncbi:MAG: hypothetical protein V5A51_05790 [Bacteroidales bacterium]
MSIDRREFFIQCGAAVTSIAALPLISWTNGLKYIDGDFVGIIKKLSLLNDKSVEDLLKRQVDEPSSRWNGGVNNGYDIPNAHATANFICKLGISYASEYSRYHLSERLLKPLERAITCLLNVQYDDGTVDLHSTNFHSTPDTAFIVNDLVPLYVCLKRLERSELESFLAKVKRFLLNTGKCLMDGGIHTANHRWVVTAALARVHSLFPSEKYAKRIDEWLSEGIDLDPDGQYPEKSVSIYSPVCDNMLITISRLADRPELLDVVRKNLEMTLYYIQPGGEVVTNISGRQDKSRIGYVNHYYYAYRYLAIKDQNPVFASVCQLIEDKMPERITDFLPYLMEDPVFDQEMPSPSALPDNYFKRFSYSGIFRIRRGNTDISVVENEPIFLTYRKGEAVMQAMALAAAFYASAQFVSQECNFYGGEIILKKYITKGYYQPYPIEKRDGDVDWNEMDREKREIKKEQTLEMVVKIKETKGKVSVDVSITGTPHVPVSWELSFRKGGKLSGVTEDEHVTDAYFLEEGKGQYRVGNDVIRFGEGHVTHKWSQMRGMLPKQEGYSVYLTGYTPFRHQLFIS